MHMSCKSSQEIRHTLVTILQEEVSNVPITSVRMAGAVPTAAAQATGAGVRRDGAASFVMKVGWYFCVCIFRHMFSHLVWYIYLDLVLEFSSVSYVPKEIFMLHWSPNCCAKEKELHLFCKSKNQKKIKTIVCHMTFNNLYFVNSYSLFYFTDNSACANHRCENGRCRPKRKTGGYRCRCKRGWSGKFCNQGKYLGWHSLK